LSENSIFDWLTIVGNNKRRKGVLHKIPNIVLCSLLSLHVAYLWWI
jgi:hypothetical protein